MYDEEVQSASRVRGLTLWLDSTQVQVPPQEAPPPELDSPSLRRLLELSAQKHQMLQEGESGKKREKKGKTIHKPEKNQQQRVA